ncbi:MAG: polyprenyl synthetase family protein [Verrucomicrobia bacterium]|nr:MAG: polyprenyl synthetase family protein [Verrucomicrobiota bacterium]
MHSRPQAVLQKDLQALLALLRDQIATSALHQRAREFTPYLGSGKMLRARLALRLGAANGVRPAVRHAAAAAVELIHAASLLHDDVIDGGLIRRGIPTFWKAYGTSGAILLGDLILFKAMHLIHATGQLPLLAEFIELSGVVCEAEAEQELIRRNKPPTWQQAVQIARRKTGALFACAAVTAGRNAAQKNALREAGYLVGTAYQIADDILDGSCNEHKAGKTLGTDHARGKTTAAVRSPAAARRHLASLSRNSTKLLNPWPRLQQAWQAYLDEDFLPVIHALLGD